MKRIGIVLFSLVLVFALIYFGKGLFSGKPPLPSIAVDGKSISVFHGTYCWRSLSRSECADMATPPEIIKYYAVAPRKVSPEAILSIKFKNKPRSDSVGANLWGHDNQAEKVNIQDNTLKVPKEKGVYVYDIYARWSKGSASFVFSIEVE